MKARLFKILQNDVRCKFKVRRVEPHRNRQEMVCEITFHFVKVTRFWSNRVGAPTFLGLGLGLWGGWPGQVKTMFLAIINGGLLVGIRKRFKTGLGIFSR